MKSQESFTSSSDDDEDNQERISSPFQQAPNQNSPIGPIFTTTNSDLLVDGQRQERPMTQQLIWRFQRTQDNVMSKSMSSIHSATTTTTRTMEMIFITGMGVFSGTYVLSSILSDCLAQWEWFQQWRYTWPFGIGALYLTGNLLPTFLSPELLRLVLLPVLGDRKSSSSLTFMEENKSESLRGYKTLIIGQSTLSRAILILLSLGMIIGGAYDVWMPVYMTGPNVVSAAGIGQDAAVGLFLWTFWQAATTTTIMNSSSWTTKSSLWFLLSSMLLLAELYKLGEGSWDELVFSHFWPLS